MADAIAIAGLASTASVAITVPLINAFTQSRHVRTTRNQDRVDDLREVFDEALVALSVAQRAWDRAVEELNAALEDGDRSEGRRAAAALHALRAAHQTMWRLEDRLGVRLGNHSALWQSYWRIGELIAEAVEILGDALDAPDEADRDALERRLSEKYDALLDHKADLLGACCRVVGPRI